MQDGLYHTSTTPNVRGGAKLGLAKRARESQTLHVPSNLEDTYTSHSCNLSPYLQLVGRNEGYSTRVSTPDRTPAQGRLKSRSPISGNPCFASIIRSEQTSQHPAVLAVAAVQWTPVNASTRGGACVKHRPRDSHRRVVDVHFGSLSLRQHLFDPHLICD